MENLIIVGAGGMGRTIYAQCKSDDAIGREWLVKGFLDDRSKILAGYGTHVGIIGDPQTYVPLSDDRFVVALGDPKERERYAAPLLEKNANCINLLTEYTRGDNVVLGKGNIFERKVYLSSDIRIDDFVIICALTIVGHDVHIGSYAHIGCFVMIGGWVDIGPGVTIHPHSTILPKVKIGAGATVGAGSVVMRDVPPGVTVLGNPAKIFQFK